jgi:hypothetical protein
MLTQGRYFRRVDSRPACGDDAGRIHVRIESKHNPAVSLPDPFGDVTCPVRLTTQGWVSVA